MSEPSSVRRSDVALGVGMTLLAMLAVFIVRDIAPENVKSPLPIWGDLLLTAGLHLPLIWRRVAPLACLAWVGPMFAVYRLLDVPEASVSSFAIFLVIFAAGAYSDDPRRTPLRAAALVLSAGVLIESFLTDIDFVGFDAVTLIFLSAAVNVGFFAAAWLLGDVWRKRRLDAEELARRADQLAAEREDRARRAVVDERVRIARELHDVVAHHVSVMGVQAAGARRILQSDPDRAAEALTAVEASSRKAVTELQRLVGFLRSADDASQELTPQPTLAEVDDLVEQVREAGLPVRLQVVGQPREVPLAVGLSAYRIVQESLTNVMKHAGMVDTTVVISYLDDAVEVEVVNAPAKAPISSSGSGRGVMGMRERTAMLGGELESGPARVGGHRIAARLPTEGAFDEVRTA